MAFNFAKHTMPVGALIQFKTMSADHMSLAWTFSHLGISSGDTGVVLLHPKPVYLKVLVNEKIHNLDLSCYTTVFGCWVDEISVLSLPVEHMSKNTRQLWWPRRGC